MLLELRFLSLSLESYCIQLNLCHLSLKLFHLKTGKRGEGKVNLTENVKGLFWV